MLTDREIAIFAIFLVCTFMVDQYMKDLWKVYRDPVWMRRFLPALFAVLCFSLITFGVFFVIRTIGNNI